MRPNAAKFDGGNDALIVSFKVILFLCKSGMWTDRFR